MCVERCASQSKITTTTSYLYSEISKHSLNFYKKCSMNVSLKLNPW